MNGDRGSQANRYAQAIVQAMLERWQSSLGDASNLLGPGGRLASLDAGEAASQLGSALPDAPPEVLNLLKLLVQEQDTDLIPDISGALAQLVTGQSAPEKAEITSAIELSESDKEALRQKISAEYGSGLAFSFTVDASLMGGVRVRVGDRLIDNSVASRLAALRESMASVVR